jgi:hypothetical protein
MRKGDLSELRIDIEEGELRLSRLVLPGEKAGRAVKAHVGKKAAKVKQAAADRGIRLEFTRDVTLRAGASLSVKLKPGK